MTNHVSRGSAGTGSETAGPATGPISRSVSEPVRRPVLRMRWEAVTYLHWDLDPSAVAAHLPSGLEPDTYEGRAYVGLVPFQMAGISFARRMPVPAGSFPETNVRTYVVGPDGGRGVFFHSLDVTRLLPTLVARSAYQLPYCWSRMTIDRRADRLAYHASRRWPQPRAANSDVIVRIGRRLEPSDITPLDDFLSARWSLYASTPRGRLLRARVDHDAWPLRAATLEYCRDDFVPAAGYVTDGPPVHVRYGGDVDVRVGPPVRL
jgi:uncharacterized protein